MEVGPLLPAWLRLGEALLLDDAADPRSSPQAQLCSLLLSNGSSYVLQLCSISQADQRVRTLQGVASLDRCQRLSIHSMLASRRLSVRFTAYEGWSCVYRPAEQQLSEDIVQIIEYPKEESSVRSYLGSLTSHLLLDRPNYGSGLSPSLL